MARKYSAADQYDLWSGHSEKLEVQKTGIYVCSAALTRAMESIIYLRQAPPLIITIRWMCAVKSNNGTGVKPKTSLTDEEIRLVINAVRQASVQWEGRKIALAKARRRVLEGFHKNGKARYKYHWQCAKCRKWYRDEKSVEVDHIVEIGPFKGDWNVHLARMLCDPGTGLQILCRACHERKTAAWQNARLRWSRK